MSGRTPIRYPTVDPQDRRIRRTWWFLAGTFFILGLVTALRLGAGLASLLDIILAILVVVVGCAAILHRNAVHGLEVGRRAEAESFARILQGLSRSVSPDAIVEAIIEELGIGTGADHIVVVRRGADGRALEATLVSARPGVPSSTTLLPLSDLDDPTADPRAAQIPVAIPVRAEQLALEFASPAGALLPVPAMNASRPGRSEPAPPTFGPGASVTNRPPERAAIDLDAAWPAARPPSRLAGIRDRAAGVAGLGDDWIRARSPRLASVAGGPAGRIAEQVAARVRSVYGLSHTLAAPLQTDDGVIGAIVVSRRTAEAWPASAQRILAGAAVEASAALNRAYSHRQAETRAATDALTGLPNRRYFDEFCGLLARRRRSDDAVGVLMIDIDRFKRLNDAHGHTVGDDVLRAVATAIAAAVREDDVPARFGGEEFAVLLRNPSRPIALEVAERVRIAVAQLDLRRFGVDGVTVSVGVAVAVAPDQPIDQIVEQADRALYQAKRTGRDRVAAA